MYWKTGMDDSDAAMDRLSEFLHANFPHALAINEGGFFADTAIMILSEFLKLNIRSLDQEVIS